MQSGTSVEGERTDTPGSLGGSRVVTLILARRFQLGMFPAIASFDRLDRAQTMRGVLVTD